MRENDDRTFAKSPILVENVTGDEVVFRDCSLFMPKGGPVFRVGG